MNNTSDFINSIPILNITAEDLFYSFRIKLVDQLFLYGSSTISLVGTIFNLFCVWIFFCKKEFNKQPYFLFYKILSLNLFLHNFFGIFYSLCYPNWYLSYKYQKICVNFASAFVPFHIFFHNHAILIEIGLLLDMLKLFSQTVKKILKLEPYKILIISFLISLLIGALGSFLIGPNELVWYSYETINNNSTSIIRLSKQSILYHGPNDFARTLTGSIYFIAYSLTVHVPLISIQFLANLTLIVAMRKHFNNLSVQNLPLSRKNRRKERLNKRTSLMALILCSISLISRAILLIGIVSINIKPDFFANLTLAISDLIIFLNAGILFFVCFGFNKIFRRHVYGLVQVGRSVTEATSMSNSHSNNRN